MDIYETVGFLDSMIATASYREMMQEWCVPKMEQAEGRAFYLEVSGTKEHLEKKKALWQYAKDKDEALYKKLRHSLLGWSVNIPTAAGRWVSKQGYKIANNIIGFN